MPTIACNRSLIESLGLLVVFGTAAMGPMALRLGALHKEYCSFVLAKNKISNKQEILELHRRVAGRSYKSKFRSGAVLVGVRSPDNYGFVAPVFDVKGEIEWLLGEMNASGPWRRTSLASAFLFFFLHVHPFADFNGRMSRWMLPAFIDGVDWESVVGEVLYLLAFCQLRKGDFISAMHRERVFEDGSIVEFVERICWNWNQLAFPLLDADPVATMSAISSSILRADLR